MTRYAVLEGATVRAVHVVELVDGVPNLSAQSEDGQAVLVPLADAYPAAWTNTPCSDATQPGWTSVGGVLSAPVPAQQPDVSQSAQLSAYAAARRYAVETGGIVVNGAPIATDRESQAMIGNAYAYVIASSAASVSYKTTAGFVTLTADQIKAVALAVGAHVQACFKAEDEADAAINVAPPTITTFAQVDAAFAALIPAASSAAA